MLRPLNNYLIIKPHVEDTTKGGLYIPQNSTSVSSEATNILNKGEVIESRNMAGISNGSIVYYNKYAITNLPDNKELVLVRVEDLYAVEE